MAAAPSPEDLQLRGLLLRASVLPLAVMVAVAAVLGWQIDRQRRLAAWVDHTDRVLARQSALALLLAERESGLRGYLLSGASDFLELYSAASAQLPAALEAAEQLVSDNPEQGARLRRVRQLAERWGEVAQASIAQRGPAGRLRPGEEEPMRARKLLLDQVRLELRHFADREYALRAAREQEARAGGRSVLGLTLGLTLFVGVALVLAARASLSRVAATYRAASRAAEERARALAEAEERFRLFVEGVRDAAIYMLDPEGRVRSWNSGVERIKGYRPEEIEGRHFSLFYTPEDVAAGLPERELREAAERGQTELESWRVRKDGTRFWASVTVRALRGEGGRLAGYAKLVLDTTERKRAELRRAAAHEVARSLVEGGSLEVALPRVLAGLGGALGYEVALAWELLDGALRTTASWHRPSPRADLFVEKVSAMRFAPGEAAPGGAWVTGAPAWVDDLRRRPDYPRAEIALEAGLHGVLAFPVKVAGEVALVVQLLAPDPRPRDEDLVQLCGALGIQIGAFVERERMERHAHEAERRRAEELERRVQERTVELTAVNKELEAFSYSVSHDLRAPLRAMDGFSQVLCEDYAGALDAAGQDYLRRIRAASQRMSQLIDDLIELSRVTRSDLRREPVDLSALFREAVAEVRSRDPGREVEVVVPEGLSARGDARLLRSGLVNLAANAFKFTRRVAAPRVELLAEDRPEGRVFGVRDNGAGFDMAYAGKLFQPFQRLHAASEFEGSGIGLATWQRIVRRHGGRAWAEGAPGHGATIYFTLGEH